MKQNETIKSLMGNEDKFRLLLETSLDGVLIGLGYGSITAANPIACEMLGRSEEELRRIGSSELFDHDDPGLPVFLAEQTSAGNARGNLFLRKEDGAEFPADLSASEYENDSGNKITVLVIHDLTEYKRLDEALHKANQKIATVLDSITDIYFTWDREGRFTDLNQQAEVVMGKTRNEAIGNRLTELFPKTKKEYFQFYWTAMASRTPMFFDALFLFGRWFEAHAYPSEEGLSVYFKDITKRKRAEKTLRMKTQSLEEVNAALKVLLRQLEGSKADIEGKILSNVRELVLPYIDNFKNSNLSSRQLSVLNIVESNLNNIISSFLPLLKLKHHNLTPREIEIASLVKEGRSIKDIAELLSIGITTVQFHRNSLRKKFGLKERDANLRSYLLSLH
ncbi:MAG: PAS domain S-box protein [Proteobacteria bacterium]|nr:PAS domain S-box protein [Pseudomonadota bacterium]MBU4009868.1 PAS domain S-box protein [Pseudomonadota bacterium]